MNRCGDGKGLETVPVTRSLQVVARPMVKNAAAARNVIISVDMPPSLESI